MSILSKLMGTAQNAAGQAGRTRGGGRTRRTSGTGGTRPAGGSAGGLGGIVSKLMASRRR